MTIDKTINKLTLLLKKGSIILQNKTKEAETMTSIKGMIKYFILQLDTARLNHQ